MTTKASDVLDLSQARALLDCAPSQSLLDGVRALVVRVPRECAECGARAVADEVCWLCEFRALRTERDAALADANALRELLLEEQALRHEYGSRLARLEAEAQRPPSVVAVSEGPTFVVVDTEGGGTWQPPMQR